ncbi:MAG: molybdenum cofactor guanylyltransferase [Acidimicrobiales bacterium]
MTGRAGPVVGAGPPIHFRGAVLTGGASRRMGTDKALLEIGGRALASIAAHALLDAGARRVDCIGGDLAALRGLGLQVRPDRHPGEGPLGALADALRPPPDEAEAWVGEAVMVLTCDLPLIDAATIAPIVAALAADPEADVAAPDLGARPQFLSAAYRPDRALPAIEAAFDGGERAVRRGLHGLRVVTVAGLDARRLQDADTPSALAALTGAARPSGADRPGTAVAQVDRLRWRRPPAGDRGG